LALSTTSQKQKDSLPPSFQNKGIMGHTNFTKETHEIRKQTKNSTQRHPNKTSTQKDYPLQKKTRS